MAAFDGELHLRLLGERTLADWDEDEPLWASPLPAVAAALTQVGAVSAEVADAVLDDYDLAGVVRDENAFSRSGRLQRGGGSVPGSAPGPTGSRRVVGCNRVIEHHQGVLQLRYVVLTDDATTMAIVFRSDAPLPAPSRGLSRRVKPATPVAWGPPLVNAADDRGTTTALHFNGSHDGLEWRGHLEAATPLAPDAAWLEIDGTRVDLGDAASPLDVVVEDLPEQDAAHRHLWRLAASARRYHPGPSWNLRAVADALVVAGALAPDDPCIEQVEAVVAAIGADGMPPRGVVRALPEPWGALIRRLGRTDGRFGTVAANAVTPAFDGITVAVDNLDSLPDSWHVDVDVVPADALLVLDEDDELASGRLTWWARDDCGNAYLGVVEEAQHSGAHASGRAEFRPALDPRATHVDLMPTAETQRAVIRIPLRWRPLQGASP